MPIKRQKSVRVADIVVPDSLIATTRGGRDWTPFRRDQELEGHGPMQTAIRRTASKRQSVGRGGAAGRPTVIAEATVAPRPRPWSNIFEQQPVPQQQNSWIGRPRKTSDPATLEEAQRASRVSPALALGVSHYGLTEQAASELTLSDALGTVQFPGSRLVFEEEVEESSEEGELVAEMQNSRIRQRSSIYETYERAKTRGVELDRKPWMRVLFEYAVYTTLLAFVYFVLVGLPLWRGAVYWLYWVFANKLTPVWGWSITMGVAFFLAFAPLLIFYEEEAMIKDADGRRSTESTESAESAVTSHTSHTIAPAFRPGVSDTALLIPCYKSARIIGPTLQAALRIFPPSHIFVIANGNAPAPLDDTEAVCRPYGVNHIWSPVGSKIVAQFVGCHAARGFRNVLLIDDDCALPPSFPVVSERLTGRVQCVGYTIKSVGRADVGSGSGPDPGTWCQQAQDLEYKISGLQRAFAGRIGSATFPHGAISLWDRRFLIRTFHDHPGFSVSEDWFFGHSCRRLGGRITMCTAVFVQTETPAAVFYSAPAASRGGFGEMTVFRQRFSRWNFFFVNGMWYNLGYVLTSWRLGWWELGAKLFVLQEVYETLLYLLAPFVLPISFVVQPAFSAYLFAATLVLYYINIIIFNLVHLRRRNESVSWTVCLVYYMPYKMALSAINVASCYWSLFKYARYFARRHPKVVEDEKAVEVVLRLEETTPALFRTTSIHDSDDDSDNLKNGRRMTAITAVHPRAQEPILGHHIRDLSSSDSSDTVITIGEDSNNTNITAQPCFWPQAQRAVHIRDPEMVQRPGSLLRKTSWSQSMV
ncbi:glycosyl group 2 family protein [Grosmannia clavigera kw1407]|uniref:Glycosyl group 2 family protein n=1 Tax=Grosmannia clavigera (strain kw1407 / UAMH 11150) TaxID=655863 RepID=F0XD29_GROCL|nr:glycosyl group 2 family protein [Grosmannia clavigera kw1407]EFX03805.1 glycosyl group 2 family protein [Grosmannia clavigera kw1407]